MSDNVGKPEVGFKTQDEIKLKASPQSGEDDQCGASANRSDATSASANGAEETQKAELDNHPGETNESQPENDESGETEVDAKSPRAEISDRPQGESAVPVSEARPLGQGQGYSIEQASTRGLKRHRLIIATCFCLSLVLLALSTVDLSHLIEREATLDADMHLTFTNPLPELPPSLSYDRHTSISGATPDLLPVTQSGWKGKLIGFVDKGGKVVVPPQFSACGTYQQGRVNVKVGFDKKDKWGYIDGDGKLLIAPKYTDAYMFQFGHAIVKRDKFYGLIDRSGREILKPEYMRVAWLQNALIAETARYRSGIVNLDGKWILPPIYSSLRPFFAPSPTRIPSNVLGDPRYWERQYKVDVLESRQKDLCGVVTRDGKVLIEPKYEDISSFSDGVAAVSSNGKYGFIAAGKDQFFIEPAFDSVTPFADLIAVKKGSKWSLIERTGKLVPSPSFDGIIADDGGKWFSDGLGAIVVDKKVGYVDKRGQFAIKPQFDVGTAFVNGHALVYVKDRWRVIDAQGRFLPGLEFGYASGTLDGGMNVSLPGPLYQIVEAQRFKRMHNYINDWMDGKPDYFDYRQGFW